MNTKNKNDQNADKPQKNGDDPTRSRSLPAKKKQTAININEDSFNDEKTISLRAEKTQTVIINNNKSDDNEKNQKVASGKTTVLNFCQSNNSDDEMTQKVTSTRTAALNFDLSQNSDDEMTQKVTSTRTAALNFDQSNNSDDEMTQKVTSTRTAALNFDLSQNSDDEMTQKVTSTRTAALNFDLSQNSDDEMTQKVTSTRTAALNFDLSQNSDDEMTQKVTSGRAVTPNFDQSNNSDDEMTQKVTSTRTAALNFDQSNNSDDEMTQKVTSGRAATLNFDQSNNSDDEMTQKVTSTRTAALNFDQSNNSDDEMTFVLKDPKDLQPVFGKKKNLHNGKKQSSDNENTQKNSLEDTRKVLVDETERLSLNQGALLPDHSDTVEIDNEGNKLLPDGAAQAIADNVDFELNDSSVSPFAEEICMFPELPNIENDFELIEPIGTGGFCVVHKAFDNVLKRYVAIKTLSEKHNIVYSRQNAFIAEAQVTATLDHPNIIPIHGLYTDNLNRLHLVEKLIEGKTLGEYMTQTIDECKKMTHKEVIRSERYNLINRLEIFLKVCDAIGYAHNKKILHRDIKPGNIMIGQFHEVYVMDWGIAESREAKIKPKKKSILGTLSFMAPELLTNVPYDSRSDIYSLGVLLFYLVYLKKPFPEKMETNELIKLKTNGQIYSQKHVFGAKIPRKLNAIIRRSLATKAKDRYQSVQALADDLHLLIRGNNVFGSVFDEIKKLIRNIFNS